MSIVYILCLTCTIVIHWDSKRNPRGTFEIVFLTKKWRHDRHSFPSHLRHTALELDCQPLTRCGPTSPDFKLTLDVAELTFKLYTLHICKAFFATSATGLIATVKMVTPRRSARVANLDSSPVYNEDELEGKGTKRKSAPGSGSPAAKRGKKAKKASGEETQQSIEDAMDV